MGSGAARSPQFRVAGKRGLSRLRIVVRNGDGRRRAVRCTIHLVPGIWRASGGLVGGPALAPENELASSISAKASSYAMTKRLAMGLVIAPHGRLDIDYEPRFRSWHLTDIDPAFVDVRRWGGRADLEGDH